MAPGDRRVWFFYTLLSLTNVLLLPLEKQTLICSAFGALVKLAKNLAKVKCVEIITTVSFFFVRETSLTETDTIIFKFTLKALLFEVY